eukprot:737620-Amphidinium_carterae.2
MAGQAEQNSARIWQQSMSSKLPSSTTAEIMKHVIEYLEHLTTYSCGIIAVLDARFVFGLKWRGREVVLVRQLHQLIYT